MFNLATKITLIRIFIVPIVVALLYFEGPIVCLFATLAFIVAAFTDWIDGYIARRDNMVTSMGKFLDPLADKVLICSVLIMLVHLAWIPAWIAIIIVSRELIVTGLRAIAIDEGIVLAADKFGKLKTVLQIFALIPLMLHYNWGNFDFNFIGTLFLYLAMLLAVVSGANYCYDFYKFTANKHCCK